MGKKIYLITFQLVFLITVHQSAVAQNTEAKAVILQMIDSAGALAGV